MGFNKKDNPLFLGAIPQDFNNARTLRGASTQAEEILWNNLRNRRLKGYKFRRQHPIGGYIADFYCHEAKLIVEVDGEIHDLSYYHEYDEGRRFELESQGIKLIRFKNHEIMEEIEAVLNRIAIHL